MIYHYHNFRTDVTFYEANWEAAFALARTGRILDLIEGRFGENAKDVVQNLLLLGHTQVGDLIEAYAQKEAAQQKAILKAKEQANGAGEDVEMIIAEDPEPGLTKGQLEGILYELLQCGFLQPVTAILFKSPSDTYDEIEQEETRNMAGSTKGPKKAEALKSKIREQLQAIRKKASEWQPYIKGNNKRGRDGHESYGPDKRRKLANGASTNGFSNEFEEIKIDVGS